MEKYADTIKNIRRYKIDRIGSLTSLALWTIGFIGLKGYIYVPAIVANTAFRIDEKVTSNKLRKSEAFQDLKAIYDSIIPKASKLANELDLINPAEVMALVTHLYNQKYLSYRRDLEDKYAGALFYEKEIYGAISLNGHGVCRHKATLLNDLNYELIIPSERLSGIVEPVGFKAITNVDVTDVLNADFVKKITTGEITEEELEKVFLELAESTPQIQELEDVEVVKVAKKTKNSLPFNHMIVKANDGINSYYLDPTKKTIYGDAHGELLSTESELFTPKSSDILLPAQLHDKPIPSLPIKRVKDTVEIINGALDNFRANTPLLDDFHADIQPSLEEAEEIFQVIKKMTR